MTRVLRFLVLLVAGLALARPAAAQILKPAETILVQSGGACVEVGAAKDCVVFNLGGLPSITIQVSGTWTGTLTVEATSNGTTWSAAAVTSVADPSTIGPTTTANGQFSFGGIGPIRLRVRSTAAMTGSAVVTGSRGAGRPVASSGAAGAGDITSVVAGGGLINCGITGAVTCDVGAGAGLTVNADDIQIATAGVTLAMMANLAQDQFIGRATASAGVPETATITAAARTALDDVTVAAMVDTLGGASSLGTGGLVRGTSPTLTSPVIATALDLPEVTAFPGSPAAGWVVIVTDDSAVGACDSAAGSSRSLCVYNGAAWVSLGDGGAGGGAPTDATYITQTAHGSLSAEQALGALATGCLGSTTTTGVAATRTLTGTANEIAVANGNCSAAPTFSIPATFSLAAKTSFNLPDGAAPVVDAAGELAHDNNYGAASNGLLTFHNGSAASMVVSFLAADTPVAGDIPVWSASGYFTLEAAVTVPIVDTQTIIKGSVDATKLLRFEVDGFTTATTRVITPPNSDTTLPIISQVVTISGPTAARTYTFPDASTTVLTTNADVTYAQITAAAGASRLLGRGDSGAGDWQEVTLGSGLSMTGTVLSASGGGLPAVDTTSIVEGSGDGTKEVRIEADGITTGTVRVWTAPDSNTTIPIFSQIITFAGPTAARTYTFPDAAATIARTDAGQTFTGVNTFTSPTILTSLATSSGTFSLFNTTATTINAFGDVTTLNIGAAGAAAALVTNFGGGTTAAEFRFLEPSGSGTNYTAFKAAAQSANITYTWPTTAATAGQFLRDADGLGALDWETIAGGGDLLAANNLSDVASATTSATNLGLGTGNSPQFTAVNIGAATDTTVTRVSAGVIAVEGATIYAQGGALGTPASGTATNITGLPPAGVTFAASDRILCRDTAAGGAGEECTAANIFTMNGTVTVAQGGSGAATLTGMLKGNGTSAFTTITAGTGVETALAANTNATDGIVTPNGTKTLTNTTVDAEATGNVITLPLSWVFLPAATQNGTASLGCSTGTSGAATASTTGTTIAVGMWSFVDASTAGCQFNFPLPTDINTSLAVEFLVKWRTSATTGNAVWQVRGVCAADAETIPTAYSTSPSEVIDAAKGITLQLNDATLTVETAANKPLVTCASSEQWFIEIFRDPAHASDTITATAEIVGLAWRYRAAK